MDNENKNFSENELTPEERVQEDISNKIADAAAEVQDEILEANGEVDETEEIDESYDNEAFDEAEPEKEPEPVVIKKGNFILSLIAAALAGVIITVCCFMAPSWIQNIPAGTTVATVGNTKITDLDMGYYIFTQVYKYAQDNSISQDKLSEIDWNKDVDGVKLSDKIKNDAIESAIKEAALIEKGKANGVKLADSDLARISAQIDSFVAEYGKDGFNVELRSTGIKDVKEYTKLVKSNTLLNTIYDDIKQNPDKYYPEDRNSLADYVSDDQVSVKHILIKVEDEATDAEKRAQAQSILDRINAGEDFDALMSEFNEDTGEPETGYTFGKGEMDKAFEEASFALKADQVSELVRSSYGYHIIKRIAPEIGDKELYNYIKAQAEGNTKIRKGKLAKISVEDIVKDIVKAFEELEAKESEKSSSK